MIESFFDAVFLMDGKGLYVWSVLLIFFLLTSVNLYIPYRKLKKLKKYQYLQYLE